MSEHQIISSAKQLAACAGICPGSSALKRSAHITAGNKYLKTFLYQCGGSVGRSNSVIFSEFYSRISRKGSKKSTIIACAHKILRIVYKILSDQTNRGNEKSSLNAASI